MSFILDALKKSELERQRQTAPGLMDTGIARPRARLPTWAVALVVLLGVNLAVLLLFLYRGSPQTPARTARAAVGAAPGAAAALPGVDSPAAPAHFSPLDGAPVFAPEIPLGANDGATAVPSSTASASASPSPSPSPSPHLSSSPSAPAPAPALSRAAAYPGTADMRTPHRDPLLSDEDPKVNDEEVLPSISELNLTGAQALPDLHLDVHVYATKPAERFVYINMRKYHEGTVLQEGPTLERIRRDGVVLNFNGLRFLLPRQQ